MKQQPENINNSQYPDWINPLDKLREKWSEVHAGAAIIVTTGILTGFILL